MFNRNIFSSKLIKLRTDNNVLAKDLANSVGVSKQAISQYEKLLSTPSVDVLISIADYFNVSLDYLTGRSDKPDNPNLKK
ncbi:helix-turn-helix transcriptional regulator [Sedimentibacter sp. zth1]|uniref:helix-turn-helix domain-containing protein n=1 Tax=Sedimentibacter sp. zth1 TaxID=2816908 RepID=UPI001A92F1AC|nr:helix-turn-helix transcriptional regulator [Sedimentibacter sp. zth1]QSX05445.1 helix-turn-helix transcriptional regulator [Sedimentibacter sp. zth1]